MPLKLTVDIVKDNAKASGTDENEISATLMNENYYQEGYNLTFSIISGKAEFSNSLQNITTQTNVLGKATETLTSQSSGSVTIEVATDDRTEYDSVNVTFISVTPDISQVKPVAVEATKDNGTLLTRDDYYSLSNLTVRIPQYEGMAAGQTLKVYWIGRTDTYGSEIIEVKSPGPIDFKIPRVEFIDTIGLKATIYFTLKIDDDNEILQSDSLLLQIEAQDLSLPPPDINSSISKVYVTYPQMAADHYVSVRITDLSKTYDTPVQAVGNNEQLVFNISSSDINAFTSDILYINYSVTVSANSGYQFSYIKKAKKP